MQRFFLLNTPLTTGGQIDLHPLRHQLIRVLRAQPGQRIVLLDGSGSEFVAELCQIDRTGVWAKIVEQRHSAAEAQIDVALYACVLKADKMEWVLQKATELGVNRFVPVISQRTIVRPISEVAKKLTRWQAIVREAAEQCGRTCLPQIAPPLMWNDAIAQAQGPRAILWEGADSQSPSLPAWLARQRAEAQSLNLLIGPEGGLAAEEVQAAQQHDWQTVTLGRRILRAETAALAAVTLAMASWGELGQSDRD